MKFKVGDKVKIKKNLKEGYSFSISVRKEMEKYAGKIMTIRDIENNAYKMNEDIEEYFGQGWHWGEDMIEGIVNFTKSDLKDGDIVTYKDNHKAFVGENKSRLYGINEMTMMYLTDYDEKLNYKTGGHKGTINDIIKVERLTGHETIFERKEEILDEAEKRYLRGVIRPFRDRTENIKKVYIKSDKYGVLENCEYICFDVKKEGTGITQTIHLPIFKSETMYKGMESNKEYTLEELGL